MKTIFLFVYTAGFSEQFNDRTLCNTGANDQTINMFNREDIIIIG